MSQYPYLPPQFPYGPPVVSYVGWSPNVLRAAKVASILQFILGGVILLAGTCLFGFAMYGVNVYLQQMQQQNIELPAPPPGWTVEQLIHIVLAVMSGLTLVTGAALIALGFFVRGGGKVASILSICIVVVVTLFAGINFLSALARLAGNPALAVVTLAMCGGMVALCIATLMKLSAAVRAAGSVQSALMQQQAQYWASIQQQQQQQPPGYGYGYNVPPVQQNYPPPPVNSPEPPKTA